MSTMKDEWQQWGTITVLEHFGQWANQPPELNIGYPKKTAFAKMQGGSIQNIKMDDDTGVFIQDCLNKLDVKHSILHGVIVDYYVKNRSLAKISNIYALSRPKVYEKLRMGEAWIDSKLDDYFRLAEANRKLLTINLVKQAA